jgi:hypothetical protein
MMMMKKYIAFDFTNLGPKRYKLGFLKLATSTGSFLSFAIFKEGTTP